MSDLKNGGPAFPFAFQHEDDPERFVYSGFNPGMSLRAYFAGRALPAIIRSGNHLQIDDKTCRGLAVMRAVSYADLMIEELSKPKTESP